MIKYEDLVRALKISYGAYGHQIHIQGYDAIHYTHEIFTERGKALTFEEYQYTWGGQAITEERFRIYLDEFDDNLTDEQIIQRFIELIEERGPYLLRERK